jgi:hypothetical protein
VIAFPYCSARMKTKGCGDFELPESTSIEVYYGVSYFVCISSTNIYVLFIVDCQCFKLGQPRGIT